MRRPRSQTETPPRPARGRALLGACLGLATLWAGAASYGLLFRDDALGRLLAREGAMQAAYEARLTDLRAEIDAGRAAQAALEAGLARRLATALERQAELERRQSVLTRLPGAPVPAVPDPAPILFEPSADELGLRGSEGGQSGRRAGLAPERLAALEAGLDRMQGAQAAGLAQVTAQADRTIRRLRGLIRGTGLDLARFGAAPAPGIGGPLVPVSGDAFTASGDAFTISGDAFAEGLDMAQRTLGDADRLTRLTANLPLRRPILGESSVSSGFGTRLDPFTRGLALHTGLDLKAEWGEPARATAPGRVVQAEPAGGYGNMVEIDHGRGIATRYAHLGQIAVVPGQWLRAGDLVGRVGSTGRSTGAHLHYETRIDGEPVDPTRFLDAGRWLEAAATP